MMRVSGSRIDNNQLGQGLVAYALLLSLVAVVLIAALSLFGSFVDSLMEETLLALNGDRGRVVALTVDRPGREANTVVVTVTVDDMARVQLQDSQSGVARTVVCADQCTVKLEGVGFDAGVVTAATIQSSLSADYGPKSAGRSAERGRN